MQEIIKLLIGIIALVAGWFIGDYLAKITKEELKEIQLWIKGIILISLIAGIVSLIIRNDWLMFGFFFVAIVSSRSLIKK